MEFLKQPSSHTQESLHAEVVSMEQLMSVRGAFFDGIRDGDCLRLPQINAQGFIDHAVNLISLSETHSQPVIMK